MYIHTGKWFRGSIQRGQTQSDNERSLMIASAVDHRGYNVPQVGIGMVLILRIEAGQIKFKPDFKK